MPVSPVKYTKNVNVKLTNEQHSTLEKLRKRNIKVSKFIREAIKEKIQREASELRSKKITKKTPW